ncbi:MAG: TonB-dependent receptor [Bacteroidota bacterium]
MKTKPNGSVLSLVQRPVLFAMKILIFFFSVLSFGFNVEKGFSQNAKITFDSDVELSVKEVFKVVKRRTDHTFIYKSGLFKNTPKIPIKRGVVTLGELLEKCKTVASFDFEFSSKGVILLRKVPKLPTLAPPQQKPITGTVTDTNGVPLPGASIVEKGTTNGVTTDFDGNFTISVSNTDAILVLSYIGYSNKEIAVGELDTLAIELEQDVAGLEEVVVIGYGTQQVKDLTGSVSVVSDESIENRQAFQLSDALQGSTAGVTVTRSGGRPGASSEIRVRGITSLNVNNPLVIVDGVQGLSLDDVNPNDVESISVLKDAASQAIYGARAASGVILVTTKRGKDGRFSIDYDYELGISSPTTLPSYVDAKTYRTLANEYSTNDGGGETFDPDITEQYEQLNAEDPDLFPDTDWQEAILNNQSPLRHRHNLAFALGSEKVSTRASFSYVTEEGLYPNNEFERYTFRVNNNLNFSDAIKLNIDFNYRRVNTLLPGQSATSGANSIVAQSFRYPGIFPAIRTDGEWGEGKDGENPLAEVTEGGRLDQELNQLNGRIGLTIKPLKNIEVQANFVPTFDFNRYDEFVTPPLLPRTGSTTEFFPRPISSLEKRETTVTNLSSQAIVSYNNQWVDHSFGLLGGYEDVSTEWERFGTTSRDLQIENRALGFGDPSLTLNSQNKSKNVIRSFFGRLSYDYKGKYLLQSNFRADGSSRFAKENRWGYFPSLSLGWVVSNESFSLPNAISFLKLRASYGEVGNEQLGIIRTGGDEFFNFYPYQSLFETVNSIIYDGSNFVSATGITQNFLGDQGIVWETTRTIDVGADLGLFDDQIRLTLDYYRKQTDDIIIERDLPDYLGFPENTRTNAGSIEVEGVDIELGYRNQFGDLGVALSTNLSFVDSEILDVGGLDLFTFDNNTKIHSVGESFGEWFGFRTNGLFQTQEEINAVYGQGSPFRPGDVWIEDQLTVDTDGDGVPDSADGLVNGEDRVPLAPSLPRITYGGSLSLNYKGLDFNVTFNGVGKHTRRFENIQVVPLDQSFGNFPDYIAERSWRPGNSTAQNLQADFPRFSGASGALNYSVSDFFLYNASYLRIQNITLGYTFPRELTEKNGLKRLRVYLALRNFFTFERNFLEGWDPEVNFNGDPVLKSVLMGVNVKI